MTGDLRIETREVGGTGVLGLSGRLDFATVFDLTTAVRRCRKKHALARELVLDFADVEWLDSMAMGTLLTIRRQLEAEGKLLVLSGCKGKLLDALRLANFHKLFELR
jgi:anti-anti-sigma factor